MDTAMKVRILDVAEAMIREKGYNGFSFREIANSIGIKSASVHYHFPTKGELVAALVRRYTDTMMDDLGDPGDTGRTPEALLAHYVEDYRQALNDPSGSCLCGVLGAELTGLPREVAIEARDFFARNSTWLEAVLSRPDRDHPTGREAARAEAHAMIAGLQGALVLSRTLGDKAVFEEIAQGFGGQESATPSPG